MPVAERCCSTASKHKCYTDLVTLCITGLFRWKAGSQAFILCADGRLDAGSWGASDTAYKCHELGYNTYALIATSNWDDAREFVR